MGKEVIAKKGTSAKKETQSKALNKKRAIEVVEESDISDESEDEELEDDYESFDEESDEESEGEDEVDHKEEDTSESENKTKADSKEVSAEEGEGYFANLSMDEKKKLKMEQKEVSKGRKLSKPSGNLISQAKALWSEVRQKSLSSDKRKEVMAKMMELITGHIEDIVLKHDASRIVQCCLKYGNSQQRQVIAGELTKQYLNLSKSQYGKFIVSKILNFCPDYRERVISSFYGQVIKMVRHRHASVVLEEAYSQFANGSQKLALLEEFYGPEFALFKQHKTNAKNGNPKENAKKPKSLAVILAENPEKKTGIMKNMKEVLSRLLQKGGVDIGPHTIIHRVLLEYLSHLGDSDLEKAARSEILALLREDDMFVKMLHTREGAKISQLAFVWASAKDRKHLVKCVKDFVLKISAEQYGHAVLMSCFECVDDTVMVGKQILQTLLAPLKPAEATALGATDVVDMLCNKYVSRVILFVFAGRNASYQPKYMCDELAEMDDVRRETSKKSWEHKQKELQSYLKDCLLNLMASEKDLYRLIRNRNASQIVYEAIKNYEDSDMKPILATLAALAKGDVNTFPILNPSLTEEPFHAVKKLKMEADLLKSHKTEVEISENKHVLLMKPSSSLLKDVLRLKKETFASMVSAQMDMHFWMKYCLDTPFQSNSVAFVIEALMMLIPKEMKTILSGLDTKHALSQLLVLKESQSKKSDGRQLAIEGILCQLQNE